MKHSSEESLMPGAMRKLGLYLGLVEDDEQGRYEAGRHGAHDPAYDGYEDEGDGWAAETAAVASPVRRLDVRGGSAPETRGSLAVDLRPRPLPVEDDAPAYRITTLHPTTYNEARTIGEHFRDGTPVIMNLTEMDDVDAKRLVDFAAGLIFGLRGRIERVTNKVFLLSPQNIEVTAEDKARIVEGGFFNQS